MNRKTRPEQANQDQEPILPENELEGQGAAVEELQKQLDEAASKRDEYLQMAQRVQADFDNFRRRNRQVSAESFDDGARAFIKTILPVADNLERALSDPRPDDPLYQGVLLVQRQLQDVFAQRGVEVINRLGEPFDPNLEDAVAQGSAEEGDPGCVCDVILKGYRMGDNILRHAMVRVVPD